MSVEFRELDHAVTGDLDIAPFAVKFGIIEVQDEGEDLPEETGMIVLELDGVQFPIDDDEATAIATALLRKAAVYKRFYELAPDHCKECVDEIIAAGDTPPRNSIPSSHSVMGVETDAWGEGPMGCDD